MAVEDLYSPSNTTNSAEASINSLFPKINDKRIITISRSGSVNSESWKKNLSRLLSGQKKRSNKSISTMFNTLEEWDVKDEVHLLMTENKPIKISNESDTPLRPLSKGFSNSSIIGKIGNIVTMGLTAWDAWKSAGTDSNTSGKFDPWIANLTTWKSGKPISIGLTFDFAMGQYGLWNAKEEVVKPIMNLLAPVLPQYMNSWMQYGAYPNTLQFIAGLIRNIFGDEIKRDEEEKKAAEGKGELQTETQNTNDVTIKEEPISTEDMSSLASKLEDYILGEYTNFTYDIRFGNTFTFYKMLPTSASTKFSNEVDQDGYPISGNIEITFNGIMPNTLTSATDTERAARFGTLSWNGTSGDFSMSGTGTDESIDVIGKRDYY